MNIRPIQTQEESIQTEREIHICATMMVTNEPWVTLGRNYMACRRALVGGGRETFVASVDGEIVGFVVLNLTGALRGYLQTICVSAEFRNQGVGTKLINFAEQYVFAQCPNIFMCVSSFNPDAMRFYQRSGYEIVGTLKHYIVDGYDEILLRKTIAPLSEFR